MFIEERNRVLKSQELNSEPKKDYLKSYDKIQYISLDHSVSSLITVQMTL